MCVIVAAVVVVVESVVVNTDVDSVLVGSLLDVSPVMDVDVRFSKLGTGVEEGVPNLVELKSGAGDDVVVDIVGECVVEFVIGVRVEVVVESVESGVVEFDIGDGDGVSGPISSVGNGVDELDNGVEYVVVDDVVKGDVELEAGDGDGVS